MSKFFAKEGIDYSKIGWITNKGIFIETDSFNHEEIAEKVSGKDIKEVEKIWIRISVLFGKNYIQFEGNKINKYQKKALDVWGLNTFLENKRVLLSQNFIDAYFN